MSRAPVITGLGLVTPLGSGADETWDALLAGRFITSHARCPLDATSPNRVHALAIAAAREALRDAGWGPRPCDEDVSRKPQDNPQSLPALGPSREGRVPIGRPTDPAGESRPSGTRLSTALVVGTSKGAIDAWMTAPPVDLSFLASVASAVRASFPLLDGPSLTLSAACASGLHALIRAAMMIHSGEANRVLVVAAEASVHPLFLGSFQRLGVLPKEGIGCRPFDQQRDGFLMSEAAAAICLEAAGQSDPAVYDSSLSKPYAQVDRYALCGDATHLTAGDPDAAALRRMLRHVVDGRPIDLVHAHGTGTSVNDPVELAAFEAECVADAKPHEHARDLTARPAIFSHKGSLGHSLGAAGLVSIVLNALSHRRGIVPPNVRTERPLPTRNVLISRQSIERRVTRSIAVGSGFGGSIGVVSLQSA